MRKTLAPHVRMRTTLLLSLLAVSFGLTTLSLLMIRNSLRRQIHTQLEQDLSRSTTTFENLRAQRRQMMEHEAELLADLPSLKALMTTNDQRTIADGAERFARKSGNAFFALLNPAGHLVACYEDGQEQDCDAESLDGQGLPRQATGSHYVVSNRKLFEVALRPLFFGPDERNTVLGYVIVGYTIDNGIARQVSDAAAADAVFESDNLIYASTLDAAHQAAFKLSRNAGKASTNTDLWLANQHYLVATVRLSSDNKPSVQLTVLKSFEEAIRYERHLNRLLLLAGAVVLLVGYLLATYVSGTITRPLEELVAGVRALGRGDYRFPLGSGGAIEIQELRATFGSVRERLQKAQQELVESERLATIGSMASSISHDLRHYLSAVYANAEFLGYSTTKPEERAELLAEVRMGVQGMTELIESLLIFSRTGQAIQLTYESLPVLTERAVALLRTHPDAQQVEIVIAPSPWIECWIDAKKVERALYNLLLNACHAAKFGSDNPRVSLRLDEDANWITAEIEDNGAGITAAVKATMFQPFFSQGKHGGSGLGLTLANRIAQEHGGSVTLETSEPGRTVFKLALAKGKLQALHSSDVKAHGALGTDAKSAASIEPGGD